MNHPRWPAGEPCRRFQGVSTMFDLFPHRSAVRWIVLSCFLGLFTGTVAPSWGEEKPGFDARDVASLRHVADLAVSPDGAHVAYLLNVPRRPFEGEDGPAWRELHVVDRQGADRAFIAGEVKVSNIAWLPDGRHISFVAKRDDDEDATQDLYLLPVDGGEARRQLSLESDIEDYSWSPDGRQVAVTASRPDSEEREEMIDKGFSQKVYETDPPPVELWIAGRDSDEAPRKVEVEGSLRGVLWAPQGERLAIKVSPTSLIDDGYMLTRVRVIDSTNGEVLGRIDNPGKLGDIAWSPDGEHLALIAGEDFNDPKEGRLMVAPASGGNLQDGTLKDLIPGLLAHVEAVQWKDRQTLRALIMQGTVSRIDEVGLDGKVSNLLPADGTIWQRMDQSSDGQLALLGDSPSHPEEVFHWQAGDAPRRLTDSNPWLAERRLAKQEVVRYQARDGLDLEGILIRPLDEEPGERYPLIMVVHGGPEAHQSNGWHTSYSAPGQLAAARGFAVFFPNYRASTGRGVAFSKLDHGDPAGKEFDDLVDGVDHLIASGLVDRERVGVTGGSYGGYATAWCATYYSHRFQAAVMSVGISNKISSLGNSDIPMELYNVHLRKWPWDNWQLYLERSPIYHVEKARTPLLIMHGEDDTRVFPGQSMELYRFLKIRGEVPVRLVFYPDEGHGNRRAASRYDYMLRSLEWMEHFLNGDGKTMPPMDPVYPRWSEDN